MFKDYYSILRISINSDLEEIKSAYKEQAKKFHPDINPNIDTTVQMQDINEAYLILKDQEARQKYDVAYRRFHKQSKENENTGHNNTEFSKNFQFEDEILSQWVQNARKQAYQYVQELMKEVAELSADATRDAGSTILVYVAILLLMSLIASVITNCNI